MTWRWRVPSPKSLHLSNPAVTPPKGKKCDSESYELPTLGGKHFSWLQTKEL